MGQQTLAPVPTTSRGLSAISALTDSEKERLFDHLQTAHANSAASRQPTESSTLPVVDDKEHTVYFSNVYSAVAQSSHMVDDGDEMILNTGSDQFIFESADRFIDLKPIKPIGMKTTDGNCHSMATHRGDARIKSYNDDGQIHEMIMPDSLYCKEISVNLISAIKLCDIGCKFEGNPTVIRFKSPSGERLYARRQANTNQLWTVRPATSTSLSVSTDVMHQQLGHLLSAALRHFCTSGRKTSGMCTSCIFAKSHHHPFQSSLPQADRLLYRVHSDVVGPLQTPTPNGNWYFVTFIDKHSRFTKVFQMKNKPDVFERFKAYMAESERLTGQRFVRAQV